MSKSFSKLKAIDFYKKIPSDLVEATLTGAWLSITAAILMAFLFGMVIHLIHDRMAIPLITSLPPIPGVLRIHVHHYLYLANCGPIVSTGAAQDQLQRQASTTPLIL